MMKNNKFIIMLFAVVLLCAIGYKIYNLQDYYLSDAKLKKLLKQGCTYSSELKFKELIELLEPYEEKAGYRIIILEWKNGLKIPVCISNLLGTAYYFTGNYEKALPRAEKSFLLKTPIIEKLEKTENTTISYIRDSIIFLSRSKLKAQGKELYTFSYLNSKTPVRYLEHNKTNYVSIQDVAKGLNTDLKKTENGDYSLAYKGKTVNISTVTSKSGYLIGVVKDDILYVSAQDLTDTLNGKVYWDPDIKVLRLDIP